MAKFIAPVKDEFLTYEGLTKYQLKSILRTNDYVRDIRLSSDEDNSFVFERPGYTITFARMFYAKTLGWMLHVKLEADPKWIVRTE